MSAASRLIAEALDGIQQLEQDLADEKARANAAEARADAAEAAVEARDARMATLALELANAEAALATRDALLAMQGAELARLDAARIDAEAKVERVEKWVADLEADARRVPWSSEWGHGYGRAANDARDVLRGRA